MAKASDAVVLATAIENYEVEENGVTRFRTRFSVVNRISGDIDDVFVVQNLRLRIGDLNRKIEGDVEFIEQEKYLIFLHKKSPDYWTTMMLSHALFMEIEQGLDKLLAPVTMGLNYHVLQRPDGQAVDPLRIYHQKKLLLLLSGYVADEVVWNGEDAGAPYDFNDFPSVGLRATVPSHCTFLGDPQPWPRWQNFPGTALPVRYHVDGDSECATWLANTQSAITNINANYTGVNLSDAGTHTYVPSCSGQGATDNEFTTWVNSNLGGTRHLVIQFEDPCNEIADLSGCSGTLAFGGLYWFGSTHSYSGINWNNAAYGYVVFNNGTGTCNCGSNYTIIMIHELTHSLNAGHIAASNGAANMNPSCCNTIQALDVECLNYSYAPLLPIELVDFTAKKDSRSVKLQWQTATEVNNDYFELQRSLDGETFETLGKITGAGHSHDIRKYDYLDLAPRAGLNIYRLKQVDYDGTFEYSDLRSVRFDLRKEEISVYPNPVNNGQLNISFGSTKEQELSIELLGAKGVLLMEQVRFLEIGSNFWQMSLQDLPNGVYWLRFNTGENSYLKRLIKMD